MNFHIYRDVPQTSVDGGSMHLSSVKESLITANTSSTFRVISSSIVVSAALLPSLRAEYKVKKETVIVIDFLKKCFVNFQTVAST